MTSLLWRFLYLVYYYYYYYYYVCCLLAGPRTYGRYVFLPYVGSMNCRFHVFRASATSVSSQCLLLFLKSSRSCVLFSTPFSPVICPSNASWRRQFLLWIRPIQLTFLHRILLRSVLVSHWKEEIGIEEILGTVAIRKKRKYAENNYID